MDTKEQKLMPSQKYMLSVKEASAYFSIGQKSMRRISEDPRNGVAIFVGNRYLIIRPRFEAYIEKMLADAEEKQCMPQIDEVET